MEHWKNIKGFTGYQISDKGRVRSFWKRRHRSFGYGCDWVLSNTPTIMRLSDDGNGYLKVMLTSKENGKRYCRKIHRLVAEAFIPNNDPTKDTVDHITSGKFGKLNNSVDNLRWISRSDNIKKAYHDGVCDDRINNQNKAIIAIDLWTGNECYFSSIKEASKMLHIDRTSISHVLRRDMNKVSHYTFEYAEREEVLLYGDEKNQLLSWIRMGIR